MKRRAVLCLTLWVATFCYGLLHAADSKKIQQVAQHAHKAIKAAHNEIVNKQIKLHQPNETFLHANASHESWLFSGVALDDNDNYYGYTILLLKQNKDFYYSVDILDLSHNEQILSVKKHEQLDLSGIQGINIKMGKGFIRYNDINGAWVLGLDEPHGFNFRIEFPKVMHDKTKHLSNIAFYTVQGLRMNGQLSVNGKNRFVTGKRSWLHHQWRHINSDSLREKRLYCYLFDGKSLSLVQYFIKGKLKYNDVDLFGISGDPSQISQFVELGEPIQNTWILKAVSPKLDYRLNVLTSHSIGQDKESPIVKTLLLKTPQTPGIHKGYCTLFDSA